MPTKTPVSDIVTAYVAHLYTIRAKRNVQRDTYYLREAFGPICLAISIKNSRISQKTKKRPCKNAPKPILANHFEQVTTADITQHIAVQVRNKGLAPKTANRFRKVLTRLYNWSMQQYGIKMPVNMNPAAKVERYKEKAPQISFLSLKQIDEQLAALENNPQLQPIVALYIYAGIRQEEALWLTTSDIDLEAGSYGMLRIRAKTIDGDSWQPKTGVNRVVPISSNLRKYLDNYTPQKTTGCFQGQRELAGMPTISPKY